MTRDSQLMLEVRALELGYGDAKVLEDVFLSAERGECIGIIGPNGSGKSTLLKALGKVIRPRSGSIVLAGRDLKDLRPAEIARAEAVVPQDTPTDFDFTALEVVLMGRNPHLGRFELEGEKDYAIARSAMELTGTWGLRDRNIGELSGGERQRAIIARALAQEPAVLLLDEPVSHLDINHQIEILELVDRLKKARGMLIVLVIHDLNLAARYCDRLLLLNEHALQAAGPPEAVLTREHIRRAFRADVLVRRHPLTGSIYITLMSPAAPARAATGLRVHVIGGAGTGTKLLFALAARGYALSAGVLNALDSDYEAAEQLGIPIVGEAPFSPVTPEASAQNDRALEAADCIVISGVPFGWGNLRNLEAALAFAGRKPVVVVDPGDARDFTGGRAAALLAELKEKGALFVAGDDEAIARLAELPPKGGDAS